MRFDARVLHHRLAAPTLIALSACASTAPRPVEVAAPRATAIAEEPAASKAEPENVGLVLRVRNPGHVMTAGFEWLGLTIPPEHLIPAFGKKPIPFDVGAPLDVLMLSNGVAPARFGVAVSMPMRSVDEMKEALGDKVSWKPLAHGAFLFQGPHGSGLPGSSPDSDVECALAPASGAAKARFVCVEGRPVAPLLPYFLETLPNVSFDHDVAIDLRQPFLGSLVTDPDGSLGSRLLSRMMGGSGWAAALGALASDTTRFAVELDHVAATIDLDARGARLEARLSLPAGADRARSSALTRLLFEPSKGPPDAFVRLPIDADFAFFGSGSSRETLEEIRRESGRAADLLLPKTWTSPDEVSRGLFELFGEPWVVAASLGAQDDPASTKGRGIWLAAGVHTPFSKVAELARALAPSNAKKDKSADAATGLRLREVKSPKGATGDAMALDLTFPIETPEAAAKRGVPKKLEGVAHILLAAQNDWTWVTVSTSEDVAKALLAQVTTGDATKSFASRPEASWFRKGALSGGGDLGLAATIDPAVLESILGPNAKSVQSPQRGPLLYATEVSKGGSPKGGDELVLRVEAPPSLGVGVFLALFKDALSP